MKDSQQMAGSGKQPRPAGPAAGKGENRCGGLRMAGKEKSSLPGKPLVSIVTIVLNDAPNIERTIDSVLAQSYSPVEYIIIDGGSRDDTVKIIRRYDTEVDYWCSEPDNGISDAFNKGILAATGDYTGILNAGDWYEQDAIAKAVAAFQESRASGVVCGALQFWHDAEREYMCRSVPGLLARDMTVTHPACFVRRDLYAQYGLFNEEYKLAMDYELLLRFHTRGVQFTALEAVLTNMQHAGLSEANWRKALEETYRARRELLPDSFFASKSYYFFILAKKLVRIGMEKVGMHGLISLYRSRLALVKKRRS